MNIRISTPCATCRRGRPAPQTAGRPPPRMRPCDEHADCREWRSHHARQHLICRNVTNHRYYSTIVTERRPRARIPSITQKRRRPSPGSPAAAIASILVHTLDQAKRIISPVQESAIMWTRIEAMAKKRLPTRQARPAAQRRHGRRRRHPAAHPPHSAGFPRPVPGAWQCRDKSATLPLCKASAAPNTSILLRIGPFKGGTPCIPTSTARPP